MVSGIRGLDCGQPWFNMDSVKAQLHSGWEMECFCVVMKCIYVFILVSSSVGSSVVTKHIS